jgi:hypothetical protein
VIVVEPPDTIVADPAVIDVATGRGVGGTVVVEVVEVVEVVDVVEVVEGTVVVVTIGARVVVVPVTIGATVVVVTTETAGAVVVVVAPVVPVLGEALGELSTTGTATITESAITGNLTVKRV